MSHQQISMTQRFKSQEIDLPYLFQGLYETFAPKIDVEAFGDKALEAMDKLFAFSLIWSLGSSITEVRGCGQTRFWRSVYIELFVLTRSLLFFLLWIIRS